MRFKLNHPIMDMDINIPDKLAIVVGESGAGKTYFPVLYQILAELDELYRVDCPHTVKFVEGDFSEEGLRADVDKDSNILFIIDEDQVRKHLKFLITLPCSVLAMTRSNYGEFGYSYRSVFHATRVDGKTVIRPKYELSSVPDHLHFDTLLTEDSSSGFRFFNKWFPGNVIPCKGKDKIVRKLNDHLIGPDVHIMLDGGGAGYTLIDLQRGIHEIEARGYKVYLWLPECFEEILLGAEFVPFSGSVLDSYTTDFINTEDFCETQIKHCTMTTKYAYDHDKGFKKNDSDGTVRSCWLKECDLRCGSCSERIPTGKKSVMLRSGPYPQLLELRPSNLVPFYATTFEEAVVKCQQHVHDWVVAKGAAVGWLDKDHWGAFTYQGAILLMKSLGDSLRMALIGRDCEIYIPHGVSRDFVDYYWRRRKSL